MDIHDIKPPGTNGSFVGADYENVETKRSQDFAATKDKVQASGPEAPSTPGLSSLANCSKAALDDPQKLEGIVRASVSELVEQGQNVTGPLTPAQKQNLVDFLSEDPTFRRQVESYLRKALV
jgi:hypothetical protein